jgi:hypothetical protein
MPDITNADLISEQELHDATGIDHHSLRRVRKWLFLDPTLFGAAKRNPKN